MVAEAQDHLAEGVAEGRLTQEEADEKLAEITERITDVVNNGRPEGEGTWPPRPPGPAVGPGRPATRARAPADPRGPGTDGPPAHPNPPDDSDRARARSLSRPAPAPGTVQGPE